MPEKPLADSAPTPPAVSDASLSSNEVYSPISRKSQAELVWIANLSPYVDRMALLLQASALIARQSG